MMEKTKKKPVSHYNWIVEGWLLQIRQKPGSNRHHEVSTKFYIFREVTGT